MKDIEELEFFWKTVRAARRRDPRCQKPQGQRATGGGGGWCGKGDGGDDGGEAAAGEFGGGRNASAEGGRGGPRARHRVADRSARRPDGSRCTVPDALFASTWLDSVAHVVVGSKAATDGA